MGWAGLDALLSTSTAARQKQVMSDQRTEQAMAPTNQGNSQAAGGVAAVRQIPTAQGYVPGCAGGAGQLHPCTRVIQPIVVRSIGENRFEIIAGERRWRASQLARLEVVPCLVKDVADEAAVAIALYREHPA